MQRHLRGIDLNLLVVLDVLAEDPHITNAAQKLHMSQPAVSNALTRLRGIFNDDLYVKTRGGMRPTPKALELKQPIRDALFAIQQQVQPEAEFDPKTASNTFAIAANEYAESIVFPAFFQYLEQVAPNICFDLHPEADSIASLTERIRLKELDIAIDYIQPKSKELICEHVFEEDLVVMACKGNPYITDEIMTAEIYRSTPHVALHPRSDKGSPTEIILGKKQIQRDIKIRASSLMSLPAIAARTNCLCTVPRRVAANAQQTLPLETYELPFETNKIKAYMIYHRDKRNNQAHSWLRGQINMLLDKLRQSGS